MTLKQIICLVLNVGHVVKNPGESVPTYYVRKLSDPIQNSICNITCGSWFMLDSLVQQMKREYSLIMVGTLQRNKS